MAQKAIIGVMAVVNHLEGLPQVAASDVKKRGWKGIMRLLGDKGPVLVTNHEQPDAVIVPTAEYERLREISRKEAAQLDATEDALRAEWDRRMAWLGEPGANAFLRSLVREPLRLNGEVKAGKGW